MKTSIRSKMENSKYKFAQNFWYHLIAPLCIIVLALILALCFNFNLGLDFKGGTVATVVVEEDLSVSENYSNVKTTIDEILSQNGIDGLVYQKETTNYYGDAIIVRFNRIDDTAREELRQDLIQEFHSEASQDDLERFVKVDNFEGNVDSAVLTSTILAVLVAIICTMVYLWIRHGTTAAFLSLFVVIFDLVISTSLVVIVRIPVEMSTIIALAFVSMYSVITTYLFVNDVNSNIKQEKYSKLDKNEIANITTKRGIIQKLSISLILLIFVLLLGVVPTYQVRSLTVPCLIGIIVVFLTSLFITPGFWSLTYMKRRISTKSQKQTKQVVEEPKLAEEDITKEPEVIVETEEKENIKDSVK